MAKIDYICPMPMDWDKICRLLEKEYRAMHPLEIELRGTSYWRQIGIPIPLILAAWNFTTNFEKTMRWQETLTWAEQHNLLWVIENTEFRKYGKNTSTP